jgi:diguanylate cyclase (GGDEF)-like protein
MTASADERLRELTVLYELLHTLASTLELPEVLRIVLARIKALVRAEAISLLLYDEERDELVFAATETLQEDALLGHRIPVAQSLAGFAARNGRTLIANRVADDARFYRAVDEASGFVTRDVLVVPLRRGDVVIGAIELANRSDGAPYDEGDARRLELLSAAVGDSIEPDELSHREDRMHEILARASLEVPSDGASLLLLDREGRELVFRASRTLRPGVIDGLRLPAGRGIAGWVARHRVPLNLADVGADPRHEPAIGRSTSLAAKTMICVPMVSKGRLRGVLQVVNKLGGGEFSEEELHLTERLAEHAAIAIENASLYRQAYLASITDDLTGLGNTRHFHRVLPELLARGGPLALLVLDLDAFKEVVDRYGHLVGSRVIAAIGRQLAKSLRPSDFAGRFGGDEFVILLPGSDVDDACTLAERLRADVEGYARLEGEDVDVSGVTASIGIAVHPAHAGDSLELFRAADAAMYEAKRRGKNRVVVAADSQPPKRA